MEILFIVYVILGYWAVKQTIDADKVFIYSKPGALFARRFFLSILLGWILIPIAIVKALLHK